MTSRGLYNKLTGRLGTDRERTITPEEFLEFLNDVLKDMAVDTGFNIVRFRGQTVAGQMEYPYPRLIDVNSIRVGVTWDDETGEMTDPGYELVDSTNSLRLSDRVADQRINKSELEVE